MAKRIEMIIVSIYFLEKLSEKFYYTVFRFTALIQLFIIEPLMDVHNV